MTRADGVGAAFDGRLDGPVDAVVVGSGPNGLAAAVRLAQAGLEVVVLERDAKIGGGARSRSDLTVEGLVHDVCSAAHPFAVASPFFASLPLAEHGLEWRWPDIDLAHPLDGGSAGLMYRSIDDTAAALGVDGNRWRQAFGPLSDRLDHLADDILGPLLRVPDHPFALGRFGLRAAPPAMMLARWFSTPEAQALFIGNAAHAFRPLRGLLTSSVGVMLIAGSHARGWPVARGGSQAIADALGSLLVSLGGRIETGVEVSSLDDLPPARIVMLDTSPSAAARICGDRLPARIARSYRRFRHGPGAFKLDLAVEGGIPWTNEATRLAGTVHVGGTAHEIADAEASVVAGRMPDAPFLLVGQQYLCDPERSVGDVHPVWTYAHVPAGYAGDATEAILRQLERFAPGTRDRIVAMHTSSPADLEAYNPNYIGGDIATGSNDLLQLIGRPRFALDPYATGIPGTYICSAATPPGAGVHGMSGFRAATNALRSIGISG